MTTAFVFSGGCSLGALQVGMLQALADRQVTPDLLVGTSAGALNAAFVATHGSDRAAVDRLADLWSGLRARTLFPLDPRRALLALTGNGSALCSDRGLRSLLRANLGIDDLTDAPIPLAVVASDFLSGGEVVLRTGDATSAILASCAIPGVFTPVEREGRTLVDGGLADNTAVSAAVDAGADRVYVLPAGYACALRAAPRSPISAVTHALNLLTQQRLVADIALYADRVDLVVLPPPCPLDVPPLDFSRAGELIRRSYQESSARLATAGGRREHPAHDLALHRHLTDAEHRVTPGRG
ncbi:patatin-like phospholipase family protein [Nocardioides terrisoli]|uniref:patatin-like phospholipase family protein n=1 Tax=Nocardioides terrisoli TaxID=3388267 RepID=UPI00287B9DF0|nr:patatin-like phospholipase family protein [Nocardioides marmorisolisilvae]